MALWRDKCLKKLQWIILLMEKKNIYIGEVA